MRASYEEIPDDVTTVLVGTCDVDDFARIANQPWSDLVPWRELYRGFIESHGLPVEITVPAIVGAMAAATVTAHGLAHWSHALADEVWRAPPREPGPDELYLGHDELVEQLETRLAHDTRVRADEAVIRIDSLSAVLDAFAIGGPFEVGNEPSLRRRALDGLVRLLQLLCHTSEARRTHLSMPAEDWHGLYRLSSRRGRLAWSIAAIDVALARERKNLFLLREVVRVAANTTDRDHPLPADARAAFERVHQTLDGLESRSPWSEARILQGEFAQLLAVPERHDGNLIWP